MKPIVDGCCWSGGGDKIAFEVGVAMGLAAGGIRPSVHVGTSAGAILSAGLSMFEPEEFVEAARYCSTIISSIKSKRDIYRDRTPPYVAGMWSPSLFKTDPIQALLHRVLDAKRIRSTATRAGVIATDMCAGRARIFDKEHPDFIDCVMASASFPVAFEPMEIDGEPGLFTDGYLETAPLSHAIHYGADRIFCVMTKDASRPRVIGKEDLKNCVDVGHRIVELFVDETMRNDVAVAERTNSWVELGRLTRALLRHCPETPEVEEIKSQLMAVMPAGHVSVDIVKIVPSEVIESSLDFDRDAMKHQIELGRKAALVALGG